MATPDIAKIVNMIMENPKLIEEISNMAKADSANTEITEAESKTPTEVSENVSASANPSIAPGPRGTRNRSELLCALKPYVSSERAHAIDSMLSIVEILDLMKRR